jgi:hypothetical protein
MRRRKRGSRGGVRSRMPSYDPLSRNERHRQAPVGLVRRDRVLCPDCQHNELAGDQVTRRSPLVRALSNEHRPVCETCGGGGLIPAIGKDRADPYEVPRKGRTA